MILPEPGQLFRKFKIVAKVGEGGMGEVYRAEDTRLGRSVALKFLNRLVTAEPGLADRMLLEARSLAALDHPNIVTLLDFDEAEGVPYLVLEWIDGESLDRATNRETWDEASFLRVATGIAEGLASAHKRNVVHRDLKPANVLLTGNGRVKLVDFGLAKFHDGDANLTRSTNVVGTAPYMAPEQATGGPISPATDVFAFGSLAYKLLTGQTPFQRDSMTATLYAIVHEPHTPLAERRPDLSASVVELIESCLRKDPSERPQNGAALVEALPPGSGAVRATPFAVPSRRRVEPSTSVVAPRAPEVRYCTTSDGASIAYTVQGQGPILVRALGWFTHLEVEWEWPAMRQIWERLAETYTLVRYDGRGFGMSPEWTGEFSEETREKDLMAVLDAVGAEKPIVMGISEGAWTAWSWAYAHPERIDKLVLYGGYSRAGRYMPGYDLEVANAWLVLMRKSWGSESASFRQMWTDMYFGENADPGLVKHFNHLQWAAADGDTATRYLMSIRRCRDDGAERLRQIKTPTLVIHGRDDRNTKFEEGVRLASLIPGARMLALPTATHYFPTGDETTERIVAAIREFAPPESVVGR